MAETLSPTTRGEQLDQIDTVLSYLSRGEKKAEEEATACGQVEAEKQATGASDKVISTAKIQEQATKGDDTVQATTFLSGDWREMPPSQKHSIYSKFRPQVGYINAVGRRLDAARKDGWDDKVTFSNGAHIVVRSGMSSEPGIVLRRGFDMYRNQYRVKCRSNMWNRVFDDQWIDCWRCFLAPPDSKSDDEWLATRFALSNVDN